MTPLIISLALCGQWAWGSTAATPPPVVNDALRDHVVRNQELQARLDDRDRQIIRLTSEIAQLKAEAEKAKAPAPPAPAPSPAWVAINGAVRYGYFRPDGVFQLVQPPPLPTAPTVYRGGACATGNCPR